MRTAYLLVSCMVLAQTASAEPILYSTSGQFDTSRGIRDLAGVSAASPSDNILIGSINVADVTDVVGSATFHIQFQFTGGLPSIDLSGTVLNLGYNPSVNIENGLASTTATQTDLYPAVFQEMLAQPDWVRTTSFRDGSPTLPIDLSVRPFVFGEPVAVPEPGSVLVFGLAACSVAIRNSRRRENGDPLRPSKP